MMSSNHVLLLLLLLLTITLSHGFVIAPPWADKSANPCSQSSWQLVYWEPTQSCYQIFSQGPCPDTQELGFNPTSQSPECRCPSHLPLHWTATDRCYKSHSRGPCGPSQYLVPGQSLQQPHTGPVCVSSELCEPGLVFWPLDRKCYQLYTQGPCHKGDLLIINPGTGEPYCGCDPVLLKQYYYKPLKLCYEHLTKGPCELGSLFSYNHTSDTTDCLCDKSLPNYFKPLGQCFEINNKGPCGKGQIFKHDSKSDRSGCQCKENYVYWEKTRACYREYTPGPCQRDQFLVKGRHGVGFCSKNPCSKAHLYFPSQEDPSQGHCHKVGGRGPCPLGELVVFEAFSGKSYRGDCGCSPGYNQNFWPKDEKCYEWYSQGPCPDSFLFKYNKKERVTECVCDTGAGYIFWNETNRCYRVYTQGPCPDNAWLIPTGDMTEVYCECRTGFYFSSEEYVCKRTPLLPRHLAFLKGHRFNTASWTGSRIAEGSKETMETAASENKVTWEEEEESSLPNHTGFSRFWVGTEDEEEEPDLSFFWHPSIEDWSERDGRRLGRDMENVQHTENSGDLVQHSDKMLDRGYVQSNLNDESFDNTAENNNINSRKTDKIDEMSDKLIDMSGNIVAINVNSSSYNQFQNISNSQLHKSNLDKSQLSSTKNQLTLGYNHQHSDMSQYNLFNNQSNSDESQLLYLRRRKPRILDTLSKT